MKTRYLLPCLLAAALTGTAHAQLVAYYNFEDGSDGLAVNATGANNATASLTVAGGGDGTNGLVAWSAAASPNYTSSSVPSTSYPNTLSMFFDGNDDLYQKTASTSTLATTQFTDFTIEAYVNLDSLSGWQTFVGHDDQGLGVGAASLFYLSKSGANNGFRVELITASNTDIQVNSTFVPTLNTWYHLAAVGDATAGTLTLYVDGQPVGSVSGFDGLFYSSTKPTSWTLGRGQYNNNPTDWMHGLLDEVRFSDVALDPSEFLNAPPLSTSPVPEPSTYATFGVAGLGLLLVLRRRRR